jgi:DNA-binding CsgD family transcriptional regulator
MQASVKPPIRAQPLIGRVEELAQLEDALIQAAAGHGQLRLIVGEAGIGKTRLAREVWARAQQHGFLLVDIACFETDRALPYAVGRALIRHLLHHHDVFPDHAALAGYSDLVAQLAPDSAPSLPGMAQHSPEYHEPEQTKRRMFQLLLAVLDMFPSPSLIVIEDLHWADDLSLELVLYLARACASRAMVLLVTIRTEDIHPALVHMLAGIERERIGSELLLSRFQRDHTAGLIGAMFGQHHIREEFVQAIQQHTDGNPFFIEETLRALLANGDIYREGGLWTRRALESLRIPRSVEDAVYRRLRQLSPEAHRLLAIASVLGRHFDIGILADLVDYSEEVLILCIKEAIAVGLVQELPDQHYQHEDRFEFHHALTQQAIYARLLARERRLLHHQAFDAILKSQSLGAQQRAVELARHAFAATLWQQAHAHATIAARQAHTLGAPQAAIDQLSCAIEAMRHEARMVGTPASNLAWQPLYRDLLQQRAQAYETLHQFELAHADYELLYAEANQANDLRTMWQSLLDLGFLWTGRDMEQAHRYLDQALATARLLEDPVLLGQSLNRIGNWCLNMGQPLRALACHREAYQLFEAQADTEGLATTNDLLGITHLVGGDFVLGAGHYAQAIAGFRTCGHSRGLVYALATSSMLGGAWQVNTIVCANQSHAEAVRQGEEALQITRQLRWRSGEANTHTYLALAMAERGDYGRAIVHGETALNIALEIESPVWELGARKALGAAFGDLLMIDAAQAHLSVVIELAHQLHALEHYYLAVGITVLQLIRAERFQQAEAVFHVVPALPFVREQTVGLRAYWCSQAALLLAGGSAHQALELLEQLIESAPHTAQGAIIPRLWCLRGEALLQLRQFAAAELVLLDGERTAQFHNHLPVLWQIQVQLVLLYRAQRQAEKAREWEEAARATAKRVVATISDRALQTAFLAAFETRIPQSVRPTPLQAAKHSYDGLTAREREVAAYVAHGLSNRTIAGHLVVTERTIEKHVENALAKLMFTSRAQLAVWAAEHGLRGHTT